MKPGVVANSRAGVQASSSRVSAIIRWFQIEPGARPGLPFSQVDLPLPLAGQIMLITGPSGAGKSTLLRVLRRRIPRCRLIDVNRVCLPDRPVIDLFPDLPLDEALSVLSRLGLAQAHTYLLRPRHLSAGQRWRLRLALALCGHGDIGQAKGAGQVPGFRAAAPGDAGRFLLADEFASNLDMTSAMIVSHALRRCLQKHAEAAAILACNRDDLRTALRPDIAITCDFGRVSIQGAELDSRT